MFHELVRESCVSNWEVGSMVLQSVDTFHQLETSSILLIVYDVIYDRSVIARHALTQFRPWNKGAPLC